MISRIYSIYLLCTIWEIWRKDSPWLVEKSDGNRIHLKSSQKITFSFIINSLLLSFSFHVSISFFFFFHSQTRNRFLRSRSNFQYFVNFISPIYPLNFQKPFDRNRRFLRLIPSLFFFSTFQLAFSFFPLFSLPSFFF